MSKRRNFSSQEKVSIIREHLVEQKAVSEICDKHKLHVTLFYRWLKEFFENGHHVFEKTRKNDDIIRNKKLDKLEEKLRDKDSVIAELLEDHINLKKKLGEH